MNEKIINYLRKYPGARKREIAGHLHIWHCDHNFLRTMADLETDEKIRREPFKDPAQMEFYDKWYAV